MVSPSLPLHPGFVKGVGGMAEPLKSAASAKDGRRMEPFCTPAVLVVI